MSMRGIKSGADNAAVDYTLSQMLNSPDGLTKVAALLPKFIRQQRDYKSFCRKVLLVHNIDSSDVQIIDGDQFVYYPKDFNAHATFFADDGQVPRYQVEGDGVNVAMQFVTSDDATINLKRLMFQKFDYLERVKELSAQAISKLEDTKLINLTEVLLLGNSATATPTTPDNIAQIVTSTSTTLTKDDMVDLKAKLDASDVPVGCYVLNPGRIQDLLKWGYGQNGAEIDATSQREMVENGVRYTLFGVKLITSIIIPMNTVYCYAIDQFVGRMPVAQDINVTLTDRPNKFEKGLFLFEIIGMYLASHLAVAKLIIDYTAGDPMITTIGINNEAFAIGESSNDGRPVGIGSREEG